MGRGQGGHIFFSFVTCSMHKNPHQNARNGIKDTLFFKIFLDSMPPDPPRGSRAFGASRANLCLPPPPKFLSPYAYEQENKTTNGKKFHFDIFLVCLFLSVSYIRISIHSSLYSYNKQITSWLVRLYGFY